MDQSNSYTKLHELLLNLVHAKIQLVKTKLNPLFFKKKSKFWRTLPSKLDCNVHLNVEIYVTVTLNVPRKFSGKGREEGSSKSPPPAWIGLKVNLFPVCKYSRRICMEDFCSKTTLRKLWQANAWAVRANAADDIITWWRPAVGCQEFGIIKVTKLSERIYESCHTQTTDSNVFHYLSQHEVTRRYRKTQ